LYVGNLVSSDSRTAALNILLKSDLPTATRHAITKWIYESARNAGFDQVYFAGDPFSQWRGTEAIKSDLRVFLPLTLLLIALLLWLCFRSVVAVALPLSTIGIGLLWLMGLMAWFDAPFTILGLMLPTLMLAVGCSYMGHVLNQIGISEYGIRNTECGMRNDPPDQSAMDVASLERGVGGALENAEHAEITEIAERRNNFSANFRVFRFFRVFRVLP